MRFLLVYLVVVLLSLVSAGVISGAPWRLAVFPGLLAVGGGVVLVGVFWFWRGRWSLRW